MMPLPFVKVTAKAFKRNFDDGDDNDSTYSSSSSSSSSSGSSGTTSSTRSSRGRNAANASFSASGNKSRAASSVAVTDLRDKDYTVPLPLDDGDPASHISSTTNSRFSSNSGSNATTTGSSYSTSASSTSGSESTTSGSTTTSSTSGSSTTSSASKTGRGGAVGGSTATSSSEFSLDVGLDADDVIDPRTGKHIFARTAREVKTTESPQRASTPSPAPSLDKSDQRSVKALAAHAINTGIHTAQMSIRSSEPAQSASRGLKKVKKTAMLNLRIGEYVVKTQVVAPFVTKVVQEWKGFNRFRDRHQAERRNKTLDWFEDRVATMRREEENMRWRQQEQRQTKRRAQLKQERSRTQREDFLNETRAEFKHQADLRLTTSLEKERVRNYFLDNNDGWQMQALTRHVQEDEDRERQRKRDAEAEKVRQGDANRQAAADEYLAEYDRGEVITQATLRIMRRSGIVAGVNAPRAEIKEEPLETDTYLLLRLKPPAPPHTPVAEEKVDMKKEVNNNNSGRRLPPPLSIGGIRQSSGTGGSKPPAFPAAGERNGHHQRAGRQTAGTGMPGKNSSRREQPVQAVEAIPNNGAGPTAGPVAAEGRKPSRGGGIRGGGGRAGNHNRGKRWSSQAFEVDLLRFRGVEEMRGWKLGAPGGESLASDLASGACPRLSVLRLGWCLLGDRGACAVVRALCGGGGASAAGGTLRTLDLRGNAVTVVGLRVLAGALAFGGLPTLRALDLGSNSLRDEGGKAVAHRLLAGAGTWRRLARLDLSGNGMGDGGVEAVFKAVTAPGVTLADDVEFISVRNNSVSSEARQRLSRGPRFLLM